MNKRGQVFLISAIIIIGIVISIIKISNEGSAKSEPEAFFDLGKEISFETKRVLDFGAINTSANVSKLASELLNKYSENIAKNDVAFIYGDVSNGEIYAYYYNTTQITAVTIFGLSQTINIASGKQIQVTYLSADNEASIEIEGITYTFDLKQGQNFYFVLSRDDDGEKFVTIE